MIWFDHYQWINLIFPRHTLPLLYFVIVNQEQSPSEYSAKIHRQPLAHLLSPKQVRWPEMLEAANQTIPAGLQTKNQVLSQSRSQQQATPFYLSSIKIISYTEHFPLHTGHLSIPVPPQFSHFFSLAKREGLYWPLPLHFGQSTVPLPLHGLHFAAAIIKPPLLHLKTLFSAASNVFQKYSISADQSSRNIKRKKAVSLARNRLTLPLAFLHWHVIETPPKTASRTPPLTAPSLPSWMAPPPSSNVA